MREKNNNNKAKVKKSSFRIKAGQFLYLSFTCYNQNGLWESASSCSYGFICSFVPIVFLIITIVLGFVRITPSVTSFIQDFLKEIAPLIDFTPIINNLLNKHFFSAMDIVLGFWIIWMARKLCLSIIRGLNRIFGSEARRKNWWIQVLTFISEFVLVFLVAILILATFIFGKILREPIFQEIISRIPILNKRGSNAIATISMYFIMFVCTLFAYKYLSGVRPPFYKCLICAFFNTLTFYGLVRVFNLMVNRANYNFVYGTISSIIILIVKVYFFFVLFLFFAQMIYVSEYFEQLLKSQIYFLPKEQDASLGKSFIRMLFINPSILQNDENTIYLKPDDVIYSAGEKVESVYYIHRGIIAEDNADGSTTYVEPGSMLGETLCILNGCYETSAVALTKCEVIRFSAEEFMQILQKDPRIAMKAVTKVNSFTK